MRWVLALIFVAVATGASGQPVDATTDCFSMARQSDQSRESREKMIQCEVRKADLASTDPDRRDCAGKFIDSRDVDHCVGAKINERWKAKDARRAAPNYPYGDWNIGGGDVIDAVASSEGEPSGRLVLRCDAQGGFHMSITASDALNDSLLPPAYLVLPGHAPSLMASNQSRLVSGIIEMPAAEPVEEHVLGAPTFAIRVADRYGSLKTYTFQIRTPAAARKKILEACPTAP